MVLSGEPLVSLRGITKRFGHVVANSDVDCDLAAGEIHGLLGQNGSGKTTLISILYGLHRPDAGEIRVAGHRVSLAGPRDALSRGIAMIPQRFRLAPTLTVAENVVLGLDGDGRRYQRVLHEVRRRLGELGERYGLAVDPRATVESLSMGERQRAEILRALYHECRVLLMDEPTSVLTPREVDGLFECLTAMAGTEHRAIVLVTHKVDELIGVAHRVTVLRHGRRVATLGGPELTAPRAIEAMLGYAPAGAPAGLRRPAGAGPARTVLRATDVGFRPDGTREVDARELRNLSFTVGAGEILGIAGVDGNGQRELELLLAGLLTPSSGEIRMLPSASGVAYVPSDVREWGVIPNFTVGENLGLRDAAVAPALCSWRARAAAAAGSIEGVLQRFEVDPADPEIPVAQLSGGNVRKVVLARELSRQAALIVAAQPTMALDVRAAALVRAHLRKAADGGAAVLMISSDLVELVELCDRIGVLRDGELIGIWPVGEVTLAALGAAMAGPPRGARRN